MLLGLCLGSAFCPAQGPRAPGRTQAAETLPSGAAGRMGMGSAWRRRVLRAVPPWKSSLGSMGNPSRLPVHTPNGHTREHPPTCASWQKPAPAGDTVCGELPMVRRTASPRVRLHLLEPGALYQAMTPAKERHANGSWDIILSLSTWKPCIYCPPKENTAPSFVSGNAKEVSTTNRACF